MIIKVFDVETTGLAPPEAVVEVAYCCLVQTEDGWRVEPEANQWLVNPGKPIPPEVSAVHHLIDEDVAGGADFNKLCQAIFDPRHNDPATTFLAAHGSRFERLWLTDEITHGLRWIDTYRCALRLWPEAPSHSNSALRYWLKPAGLDRSIAAASHRAFPDAYVTAHILREMLKVTTGKQLVAWSKGPALLPRFTFGKHAMKPIAEVDTGYLEWILKQQDMDEDVRFTADHQLEKRREAT
jgi:exodeoxyribonuclease X